MNSEQKDVWDFLNKELAKLRVSISVYNKIFENVNINDNAYNQAFQLLLDGLTRQIAVGFYTFFDRTKRAWSLYRLPTASRSKIDELRSEAQDIIDLRSDRLAHLSRSAIHKDNFVFISDKGLKIIEVSISKIHSMLSDIAKNSSINEVWALDWVGVESSVEILFEHLEDGGYLLEQMDGAERYELREKTRKEKNKERKNT